MLNGEMPASFEYVTQSRRGGPYVKKELIAETMMAAEKRLLDTSTPVLVMKRKDNKAKKVKKLGLKDMILFGNQMQTTQEIQMNLVPALELCRDMARTPRVAHVMDELKQSVAEGISLHDAMKRTGAFDDLILGLVYSGERSGSLEKTFSQIKALSERNDAVRRKIIGVMIYPSIVVVIAIGCIYMLMLKTVPVFVGMYAESRMTLPVPTQILIVASKAVTTYPWQIGLACMALTFLIFRIPAFYRASPWMHPYVLKIPGLSVIMKKIIQATFTRTLSDMLLAQTRIVDALAMCRAVSTSFVYKGAIARAMLTVSKGQALVSAFDNEEAVFGKMLIRAIGFGESTGKLEEVLAPMATALDRELTEYIDQIKVFMEPAMTVVIGGVVLLIMLALFIPIFDMPNLIK